MGSGGSTSKKSDDKYKPESDVSASESEAGPSKPRPKLKKGGTKNLDKEGGGKKDSMSSSSGGPPPPPPAPIGTTEVRPCDHCGEMRKAINFGTGDDVQWLCAACQLSNGGLALGQRAKQKRVVVSDMPKPQPVLKRGSTMALGTEKRSDGTASGHPNMALPPGVADSPEKRPRNARRRGGKQSADPEAVAKKQAEEAESSTGMAESEGEGRGKLKRAQTSIALGSVGKPSVRPQADYRSAQGLADLKESMGVKKEDDAKAARRKSAAAEAAAADAMEAPKVPPPPPRQLAGGYNHGDKIVTLISRENKHSTMLLELGQEGSVVGAVDVPPPENALRLLVQFHRGTDWWLSPSQVSAPSSFGSTRAAGLHGFAWGSRVRSLVTYLHPNGLLEHQELWLGDEGTVIGPAAVKGKVAVRFDNHIGEWSLWPSLVCKSEAYDAAVAEKVAGKLARGDRVKGKACVGTRTLSTEQHSLQDGEEGTVVGPGHAPGKVLVHFDSDDRVWSLDPSQLAALSSAM